MKYEEQERKIYAKYDDKTIRVYQAYNDKIADEAIKLGTFGEHFSLTRMTWIKPSFLWMMYRCGWAEKENQERVLAIDIKREAFDEIVKNAAMSVAKGYRNQMKVLFVCYANIGRSQMDKALYNHFTGTNDADSAGVGVDENLPNASTIGQYDEIRNYSNRIRQAMLKYYDIDISNFRRTQLQPDVLSHYDLVVNIAEKQQTPTWLRGDNVIWWDVKDPGLHKEDQVIMDARKKIDAKVKQLIEISNSDGDFKSIDDQIDKEDKNVQYPTIKITYSLS